VAIPAEAKLANGLVWKNTAAIGGARIGSVLLDGLVYVLAARYFGPTVYGDYLALLAFLNLVDLAADMMVMDVSVREMARDPDRAGGWLGAATLLRFGIALIGMAGFFVYARSTGRLSAAAWIAVLILPFGALRTPLALFRSRMKMQYELAVVLLTRLVNVVLFVWLIYTRRPMIYFFWATVTSRFILALLCWAAVAVVFRVSFSGVMASFKRLFWESLPMGLSGLFVAIQFRGDILMLTSMKGAATAGLYGVVAQLPEYSLYIPVIISTPILPMLTSSLAASKHERFESLYSTMFNSVVTLVIPLIVVILLMPREAVTFLFGADYAAAASVLPILILSVVSLWISHVIAITAVAAGRQSSFVWIQSICLATYLLLNWILIPYWGAAGAAVVRLVTTIIAPVLAYFVVKQRTGVGLRIADIRQSLFAGAWMAAAVFLSSRLPIVLAGAIGGIVYLGTLWTSTYGLTLNWRRSQ